MQVKCLNHSFFSNPTFSFYMSIKDIGLVLYTKRDIVPPR